MEKSIASWCVENIVDFEVEIDFVGAYNLRLEFQKSVLLAEFFDKARQPNDRGTPTLHPYRLRIIEQLSTMLGKKKGFKKHSRENLSAIVRRHVTCSYDVTFHCYLCKCNMLVDEGSTADSCNTCGGWFMLECPWNDELDTDDDESYTATETDEDEVDANTETYNNEDEVNANTENATTENSETETNDSNEDGVDEGSEEEEDGIHIPNLPHGITQEQIINKLIPNSFPLEQMGVTAFQFDKLDADHCTICVKEIAKGEAVYKVFCKHLFHSTCLDLWFRQNLSCPNCTRRLAYDDPLYRIFRKMKLQGQ